MTPHTGRQHAWASIRTVSVGLHHARYGEQRVAELLARRERATHHRSAGIPTSFPLQTASLTVDGCRRRATRGPEGLRHRRQESIQPRCHNISNAATQSRSRRSPTPRATTPATTDPHHTRSAWGSSVPLALGHQAGVVGEHAQAHRQRQQSAPDYNSAQLEGKVLLPRRRHRRWARRSRPCRTQVLRLEQATRTSPGETAMVMLIVFAATITISASCRGAPQAQDQLEAALHRPSGAVLRRSSMRRPKPLERGITLRFIRKVLPQHERWCTGLTVRWAADDSQCLRRAPHSRATPP